MPLSLLKLPHGDIVFENAAVRYPAGTALDGVSLRIAGGSTVAIVGHTGSGKSTLLNLIPRLLDPSEGRVLLDGIDLRELSPDELRKQALTRLKKKRDFRTHAFAYMSVNLVVWGIWGVIAATGGGAWPWPVFITLGWGVGLAMNAYDVYGTRPISESDVQSEMDRLGHQH